MFCLIDGGRIWEMFFGMYGDFYDFWINLCDFCNMVIVNDGGVVIIYNNVRSWLM